jgi:DNA end-binding protein Ku
MPARPTWSGSIQISLVSIAVRIYPASNPPRQVEFHQIDRKTHHRIHHQNVDQGEAVDRADIVKGFEYARNKFFEIDPEELRALRLPTATTLEIRQFVRTSELAPLLYDRPYFVAPKDDAQSKALAIMRRALDETETCGIGEVAFSGREHLVALGAPSDRKQKGLMLYVLRYAEELRQARSVLSDIKEPPVTAQELTLAKQLIGGSTSKFDLSAYKDDYEAAVAKLVNAKRKGKPLPEAELERRPAKVVNIMDALRKSLDKNAHSLKGRGATQRKRAS